MKLAVILLVFEAGVITPLFAGSIGMARVSSFAAQPMPDPCQKSASGTSISISCDSSFSLSYGHADVTIGVSFGNLSIRAEASGQGGGGEANASASYDEFLTFGNTSMPIMGEYTFTLDQASVTISQGDTVVQLNPGIIPAHVFLTSNYVAGVPMEVSASAFLSASTPGPDFHMVDLNLIGFSAPYVLTTPEPSSILLAFIGIGLLGWKIRKATKSTC